jgi:hypothetical protein
MASADEGLSKSRVSYNIKQLITNLFDSLDQVA